MKKYIKILLLLLLLVIGLGCENFVLNGGLSALESGDFSKVPGYLFYQIGNEGSMDGLVNSSWPMYAHDRQHTGMASVKGPQTNHTKWMFEIGNNTTGSWTACAPVIGRDGTIYQFAGPGAMTGNQYYLYAINPNGTLKWRSNSTYGGYPGFCGNLIDSNGTIYIPDIYQDLNAIDTNDGSLKWTFQGEEVMGENGGPNIAKDGTIYMVSGRFLYAINPDGTLKWKMKPNDTFPDFHANPAVGPDGNIYIVGISGYESSADTVFYAVTPDGKVKWSRNFNICMSTGSPAISPDGTIYLIVNMFSQSGAQYIYAFDSNGNEKWKSPTSASIGTTTGAPDPGQGFSGPAVGDRDDAVYQSLPPAFGPDGTIYVPTMYNLLALQPNGAQKWHYEFYNDNIETPITVDNEGTVYIANSYSSYAISSNGTLKWKDKIQNSSTQGFVTMGADGTLYINYNVNRYTFAIGP